MMGRKVFIPHLNIFGFEEEIEVNINYSDINDMKLLNELLNISISQNNFLECCKIKKQIEKLKL